MRFATGLEGFVMLLLWCRRDAERYSAVEAEPPSWFQWGHLTDRGDPDGWYILIRLPSYLMKSAVWRWNGESTWHQRCLLFQEKGTSGNGAWEVIEIELRDATRPNRSAAR